MKYLKVLNLIVKIALFMLSLNSGLFAAEKVLIVKMQEQRLDSGKGIGLSHLGISAGNTVAAHRNEFLRNKQKGIVKNKKPSVEQNSSPNFIDVKIPNILYKLQVLNNRGEVIYTEIFDFIRYIEVPLPEHGMKKKGDVSRIPLEKPEAVLMIPYLPEGVEICVKKENKTILQAPIPDMNTPDRSQDSFPPPLPQKGIFYVLIMSSGFNDMSEFQTKAQEIKEYLLSKEPFASNSAKINIEIYENETDIGCYNGCNDIDRLICCDSTKVITSAAESGQLFDEIIVLHNTSTFSGGGYRDYGTYENSSAPSYCMIYNGTDSAPMALHEFGHSFGNLCDEYTYDSESYPYYDCANCSESCTDWGDISTSCQLGCDARNDYYRPEDSIMLNLGIPYFNLPSIHNSLIPRLEYFIPTDGAPPKKKPTAIFQLLLEDDR